MIRNVHTRQLAGTPEEVGALVESLASDHDRLWPGARWPALRLDAGLTPGSRGGHGPIRYSVVRHIPGREVVCRFAPEIGLIGEHRYEVVRSGGHTSLRHVLEGSTVGVMRLAWPLAFRRLHDALIEDSLDRAQAELAGREWQPRPFGPGVRLCRWLSRPR